MDTFTVLAILLALTSVFGYINERVLRLQSTIGLMLLALVTTVALGGLRSAGIITGFGREAAFVQQLDLGSMLLNGVLCFMLFAGSVGVELPLLGKRKWTVLSLAIGSTFIACLVIGGMLTAALGAVGIALALPYALVFGALISPTDPIAALAILESAGLPKPLETIINGESLFNDGVGVVLFTVALGAAQGTGQESLAGGVELFLREVLGGVLLGLLVGGVTHHMLLRTKEFGEQLLITLSTVALGYAVALQVDVSGPIAMVVAGLVVGNLTVKRMAAEQVAPLATFWHGIDEVLNGLLFVVMGLLVITIHGLPAAPLFLTISIAVVVCLVARAISVYIPLVILNATPRLDADVPGTTRLLTWGGLRGGLALALAMSLPESPAKALIVNMTFGVVAFSILVQGSTIARLFPATYLAGLVRPR